VVVLLSLEKIIQPVIIIRRILISDGGYHLMSPVVIPDTMTIHISVILWRVEYSKCIKVSDIL